MSTVSTDDVSRQVWPYLVFICVSTVFRSFETGIISSSMPDIKGDLRLTYTYEGMVAASPDYGMTLGAASAAFVFKRMSVHYVLMVSYACIAVVCLAVALYETALMLVVARSIGSFLWSFAVTHYPAWIITHGKQNNRTVMLALPSLMILVGIVSGYVVGGLAATFHFARWNWLYGLEGVLMGACAVWSACFDAKLVSDVRDDHGSNGSNGTHKAAAIAPEGKLPLLQKTALPTEPGSICPSWLQLPAEIVALLTSPVFVFTALASSSMSGAGGLILYFIIQVGVEVTGWTREQFTMVSGICMAIAPMSGTIIGAALLQRIGGYQNHGRAILFTAFSALGACLSSLVVMMACLFHTYAVSHYAFIVGSFGVTFFGACPVSATNGVTISVVPGTAHYASGLTFAFLHIVKMIVPTLAGMLIDRVGLLIGFSVCGTAIASMMIAWSLLAYISLRAN